MTKIAIVGATGPTGIHLAAELCRHTAAVRVIARDMDKLARLFPDAAVEKRPADILDADATLRATLAGSSVNADARTSDFNCCALKLSKKTTGCASMSADVIRFSNSSLSCPPVNAAGTRAVFSTPSSTIATQ